MLQIFLAEDTKKWFWSEKCFDPPACLKVKEDYFQDQGMIFDLEILEESLDEKNCNVKENLDTKRLLPMHGKVHSKFQKLNTLLDQANIAIVKPNGLHRVASDLNIVNRMIYELKGESSLSHCMFYTL